MGCARKLRAVLWVEVVPRVRGGRTVSSVAAYFDLVTDEGRLFYGAGSARGAPGAHRFGSPTG